jgi:bacterioferritin-associated ferredoxin
MIACICKGVSDSTIRELLSHLDLAKVKQVTGAGTQCGTCSLLLDQIAGEVKDYK